MFLNEIFSKQYEWYKVLIQVSLYLLQNNIIYTIASKLDPVIFQISYQMKIIRTAFLKC